MNSQTLVSVIVPVYNVESYLDRCIKSIVDQAYDFLEIILVDDGSTDRSPEICDRWLALDNRIHVIHKENGGLSDARNAGLKVASGDYIAFVDSDDYIAREMIQRLLQACHDNDSEIAACTVEMVWNDGTPSRLLTVRTNCVFNSLEAQKVLMEETILKQPVWYKLYKREILEGILFEKNKYHEDVFWSYQVIGNANRISVIDYIGYYYTQRSGSIMGEKYSLRRLDAIEAFEKRYLYLSEKYPELESEARCALWTSCIYHGQMSLKYLNREDSKRSIDYLRRVLKKHKIKHKDYEKMKMTHRVWLDLSRVSLKMTCYEKNLLGIGM